MASNATVPLWRAVGTIYITYLKICTNMVRNCLKEPYKFEALAREKIHFSIAKYVRPVAEDEMFRVIRTGKRKTKQWKRMVTKATFVGPGFTRKPPKYERFIYPSIIGVKKNPNGLMYTSLGVITKGTIIEVNVSKLGLVTPAGKVIFGKYAQVTNNLENDGCINAVLLV
ncbi:unnamed protein product [Camellia sinensis]